MSIVDAFTGKKADDERKRKLDELAESLAKIGREFGLTAKEVTDALMVQVNKKRLFVTEKEVAAMKDAGVTR